MCFKDKQLNKELNKAWKGWKRKNGNHSRVKKQKQWQRELEKKEYQMCQEYLDIIYLDYT